MGSHSRRLELSLKALELLGRERGYSLVGCDLTGINAFFVRNDLLGDHFLEPFTAENHYECPRYYLTMRFGHKSVLYGESHNAKKYPHTSRVIQKRLVIMAAFEKAFHLLNNVFGRNSSHRVECL